MRCVLADEEDELGKMAEIAEAIHDILENDGADESGASGSTGATSATSATGATGAPNAVVTPADFGAENTEAAPEAAPDSEAAADPPAAAETDEQSDDGLEAAIAADLADQPTAAIGHFGGAPDLSDITNPADSATPTDSTAPGPAAKTEAAPQSDLHYLPLRMRDTLADLKTGHADSRAATQALLDKMQTARDAMLDEMRRAMTECAGRITTRQAALQEEMAQINQELAELQTALEMLAVNHHRQNTQAHEQYQENFTAERQRVNRYRDFLQFLLRERGM